MGDGSTRNAQISMGAHGPSSDGRPLLQFAIIGGEKCGTAKVRDLLCGHPRLFMPPQEMPALEDPDYGAGGMADLATALAPGAQFAASGIHRPNYLHKPECPPRLHRHFPAARLIVVLRDPVERAVSAYFHQVRYGFLPQRPLQVGLPAIASGRLHARYPRSREVVEFGFYHRHLSRYLQLFPREQLLVLLQEALRADLDGTFRRLCAFVGIDPTAAPAPSPAMINTGIYSARRLWFARRQNRFLYDYSPDRTRLFPRKTPLRRWEKRASHLLSVMEWKASAAGWLPDVKPVVTPEIEELLADLYRDDTARLQDLLGLDLSHWRSAQ